MPANTEPKLSAAAQPESEPNKGFDLSVTQVVGGALAAMTAAALGSRLSVAGTVVGAALASIIAAVAGAMYTASLRRTRDKVRSVWTGTAGGTPTRVEVLTEEPAAAEADAATAGPQVARSSPWRSGRLWKRIAIGAVATFALAFGAVTGLELISGQALSGGSGTTFEQVREPANVPGPEQQEPSEAAPTSDTPSPSTDESSDPSGEPTNDPSGDPSGEATAPPSETPGGTTDQPSETEGPSDDAQDPATQAAPEPGAAQ